MREMKDSGVAWIGDIPSDWGVKKMKSVLELYSGNSIKDEEKSRYEDSSQAIPYIATKDINVDTSKANYANGMYVKKSDNSFKRANKDSILLCIEGGSAGRKITYLRETVAFINKLCCFSPYNIISKYLYYYLKSPSFSEEFFDNISGLIGGVSVGKLNNFKISCPPISTQQRIADYLDKKCNEIDATIEKNNKTIEDYKKLKQSIITEAVTKGIDPNVEMKNSGIEWIGDIPKHWGITKIKKRYKVILGKMLCNEPKDATYTLESYLCAQNIKWGGIQTSLVKKMWFSPSEKDLYLLNPGDLVVTEGGSVGESCIYNNEFHPCYIQNAVHRVIPREKNNNKLLYYWMNVVVNRGYIDLICSRSTIAHYTKDKVENTPFVKIDFEEQQEIVNYLDKKCNEIDSIIENKKQINIELESYKKSLIYECVTGKREV